jgi:RTX calcium-binding nonapeptide repeat (4 copies)
MRRTGHTSKGGSGRRRLALALAAGCALAVPSAAQAGHGLMLGHPAPPFNAPPAPGSEVNSGGTGAKWELIETITTGNPHTDIDYFTQGDSLFASVGTLAAGPNAGGQTILRLSQGGNVDPEFVAAHPSASCLSDPNNALGLQHDVEATPKGNALLNTENEFAVRSDTQLLIDATDAPGRCHDQGVLGLVSAPQGGLEIVDVTNPAAPVEIGFTSHTGEAHTVNVDPKRPHIAIVSSSDTVTVNADGTRANEDPSSSERFDFDGIELVDLSSCMNFPPGTSVLEKQTACRPQVYRYRYPNTEMSIGHTLKTGSNAIFGCHETEIYPNDLLTCGSGNTLIGLDLSNAFDRNGTPNDFTDDRPAGTPLPCRVRASTSLPPFAPGGAAMITDCVDGQNPGSDDLTVAQWLANGAPSLDGVRWIGSIYHQGRGSGGAATPTFDSTQDIDFNHEAELSATGETLIATDERGGGVAPPGATCTPDVDNKTGNGGVHFYDADALTTNPPATPEEAFNAYLETPDGDKAIFRVPVRTGPQASLCTAHVFHQIPGENRIFMSWYSQGTHVIDFVESSDGTIRFEEAGYFIPENANEWVSAVFSSQRNADGTETYYGATGDFFLGAAGRSSIDVYRVTLPPAPLAGAGLEGGKKAGACAQKLRGSGKRDKLFGSIAGDDIRARGGNDRVDARAGDDCVNGGKGRDRVKGGDGDDKLIGKGQRDRLKGGDGSDVIKARGGGRDKVNCGKGKDRAVVDRKDRVSKSCEKVRVR